MNSLVDRAKELARRAHAGQVDKAGRPYIEHVARVAAAVSDDPEAEAVAWLHDVLEDCWDQDCVYFDVHTYFPVSVVDAVKLLDRGRTVGDIAYYAEIAQNRVALRVKLADIADNSDEARLALLDDVTVARLRRKYAKARRALIPESGEGHG